MMIWWSFHSNTLQNSCQTSLLGMLWQTSMESVKLKQCRNVSSLKNDVNTLMQNVRLTISLMWFCSIFIIICDIYEYKTWFISWMCSSQIAYNWIVSLYQIVYINSESHRLHFSENISMNSYYCINMVADIWKSYAAFESLLYLRSSATIFSKHFYEFLLLCQYVGCCFHYTEIVRHIEPWWLWDQEATVWDVSAYNSVPG